MVLKSEFETHFLNVDHGDCTVIRHSPVEDETTGRISVVDINNWKGRDEADIPGLLEYIKRSWGMNSGISKEEYARDHLNKPVEYLTDEILQNGEEVYRFIATHPHMDHISGLKRLDDEIGFSIMWDPFHEKTLNEDEVYKPKFDYADWQRYAEIRKEETDHTNKHPTRGSPHNPWGEDDIEILHPSSRYVMDLKERNSELSNPVYNNMSYVLKVNTEAGSILLPGDIEKDGWEDILQYYGDQLSEIRVLKASHHGRKSGFHKEALEIMNPDYVILSVGKKTDTDAHSDYRRICDSDTEIISTRQHGAIKVSVTQDSSLSLTKEVPEGIFNIPGE